MALVKETVASLINGVSQQPAAVRLESQAETQENFVSDVVDGVRTRPGSQFVQQLTPGLPDGSNEVDPNLPNPDNFDEVFPTDFTSSGDIAKMIPVTAENGRDYMIVVSDAGTINVYDLEDGSPQPVYYRTGGGVTLQDLEGYLKTDQPGEQPRDNLSVVTVGDALFFANKSRTVAMDETELSPPVSNDALVWVRQGVPGHLYEISITDHEVPYEGAALTAQFAGNSASAEEWVTANLAGLGQPVADDPDYPLDNSDISTDATVEIKPFATAVPPESTAGTVGNSIEPSAVLTALLGNRDFDGIYDGDSASTSLVSAEPEADGTGNTPAAANWVSQKAVPTNVRPFNTSALTFAAAMQAQFVGPGAWIGVVLGDQPVGLVSIRESLLPLPDPEPDFAKVRFIDTSDGAVLSVAHRQVANLDLLPYSGAPANFKIKVDGDTGAREDDFYVVYDGETWTETVGGNLPYKFDLSTMPHVLERQPDDSADYAGAWIFGQGDWAERDAGDEISCPPPSFLGKEIVSMAVHKNRLVFATESTFVFSETGELKNFWATTARNVLDTEPIDIEVSNAGAERATKTEFLLSLDQALVGFGQSAQVVLEGGGVDNSFTPSTVGADIASYYDMTPQATPVLVGGKAFFLSDKGGKYASAYEYGPGDSKAMRGQDISIHVPEYIPAGADLFAASSDSHMMVVGSSQDRKKLTCYRQYYTGNQKVQSAWFNMTFDSKVLEAVFFGDDLYVLFEKPAEWQPSSVTDPYYTLEKIQLGQGEGVDEGLGFAPKVDHSRSYTDLNSLGLNPEYNVNDGGTWFDLPGPLPDPSEEGAEGVVIARFGAYYSVTYSPTRVGDRILVLGNLLDANGDFLPEVDLLVGSTFRSIYTLSHLYLKETTNETGATVPVTTGRLQLKGIRAGLKDSGGLIVEVKPQGRDGFIHEYSPRLADLAAVTSELTVTPEDFFDFFVGSNAQTTDISFINSRVTPSTIFSYEWVCNYRDKKTGRG